MVSSSSPSKPRKTRPRTPRPASTRATTGAMSSLATPNAIAWGRAGLDRGPRKLNVVWMASCFRTPATCFIAGWWSWANRKVIPTSSRTPACLAGSSPMFTPSTSRVSAVPACEDAAREPCLTTFAPAAAATSAAMVETLTVLARSPPVPTTSTASRSRVTCTALSSIAELRPSISSAVSPFARRATSSAASCTSLARPERISLSAHCAASASRPSRRTSPVRMSGQV